jgi:hypothetical protein
LDADVINPTVMAAVDSPEPGGPTIRDLADLLIPLVRHPRALGLDLSIYDPGLDPDRSCATRLVSLLEDVVPGVRSLEGRAAISLECGTEWFPFRRQMNTWTLCAGLRCPSIWRRAEIEGRGVCTVQKQM